MNPSIAAIASPELLPGADSPWMLIDGNPLNRSSLGERGIRHHPAGRVPHVELVEVLGQHAVGRVGLDVHALHAPALDEVVDIRAAERGRDGAVDGVDRRTKCARLLPVHIHAVLRHILQAVGTDLGQDRIRGGHAQELVARRHQPGVPQAAAIQQLEVESLRGAQLDDGRRGKGEDHSAANARERSHRPPGHLAGTQAGAIT
jgi:hypothetical protein